MRITSLQWTVGASATALGALILLAPHQFTPLNVGLLGANGYWLAVWLVLAGLMLLGAAVYQPSRAYVWAAHLLAGTALLTLAWCDALLGSVSLSIGTMLWAIGTLAAPLVRRPAAEAVGPGRDLWSA